MKLEYVRLTNSPAILTGRENYPRALYKCQGCSSIVEFISEGGSLYKTDFKLLNIGGGKGDDTRVSDFLHTVDLTRVF